MYPNNIFIIEIVFFRSIIIIIFLNLLESILEEINKLK